MKYPYYYRGLASIGISGLIATASTFTPPIAHAQVGLDFLNLPPGAEIGDVLARLYVYGVGLVAIIAVIMLVIGGVQYMVAGEKDPSSAKERIRNAIWGLILALCSYLILYTINPDLTKKVILTPLKIDLVAQHFTCVNNLCTIVQGPGKNDCDACRGDAHSTCVNNVCTVVAGSGTNDCSGCPGQSGELWMCTGPTAAEITDADKTRCESICIVANRRYPCELVPK